MRPARQYPCHLGADMAIPSVYAEHSFLKVLRWKSLQTIRKIEDFTLSKDSQWIFAFSEPVWPWDLFIMWHLLVTKHLLSCRASEIFSVNVYVPGNPGRQVESAVCLCWTPAAQNLPRPPYLSRWTVYCFHHAHSSLLNALLTCTFCSVRARSLKVPATPSFLSQLTSTHPSTQSSLPLGSLTFPPLPATSQMPRLGSGPSLYTYLHHSPTKSKETLLYYLLGAGHVINTCKWISN